MNLLGALVAAIGSALFAALSSVLHHRAGVRHGGIAIVLRPMWLSGTAVSAGGVALHTLALRWGQLSVVQPVLVSGLLFALPMSALLDRRRVRLAQLGWAGVVVAGLALFLASARPTVGRSVADPGVLALGGGLVLLIATVALGVGMRRRRHRAVLWALAGGCGYGLTSALLKQGVGLLALGMPQVLSSWPVYALLAVGPASVAANQAAFNAGPLASSLPMLTIADPVVAVVLGAVVFGEQTASAPVSVVVQVLGFMVMTGGVIALTRPATGH